MKIIFPIIMMVLLTGCFNRPNIVKTGLEGKQMPSFELLMSDSVTEVNTSSIKEGEPVVFFTFSPHCPYCRAQTDDLISHIDKLNGINFYLITSSSFAEFKNYYNHYQLGRYKSIVAGIDTASYFQSYLQSNLVPMLAIYDRNKKLKKVIQGKTSINLIKDIAFEQ